jgi:hypothetical protein
LLTGPVINIFADFIFLDSNGTSAWVYYQDVNSQVREIGIDDYRDDVWRDGSVGPLGSAMNGTGLGVARWLKDGGEVCPSSSLNSVLYSSY